MERATGIEPVAQAWKAWVLPLYDARPNRIQTINGGGGRIRTFEDRVGRFTVCSL